MSKLRIVLAASVLLACAVSAHAGLFHCDDCYEWRFRKYGGGYGNGSSYCSPYQGWFGSPYYGGFNGAKWNRYGWGYDGLATHGR